LLSIRIAELAKGPFEKIDVSVINDTEANLGRSRARNLAVEKSDADWIFFLDADDRIHPNAFKAMQTYYKTRDAIWGNIWEISGGVCAWRYQVPRIDTYEELLAFDPYHTLQMGHFVKRERFIPFDEDMDCGEDFKYYLAMWKAHNCIKIEDCLFLNQRGITSTGQRSATGRDWNEAVGELIGEARNDLNTDPH